MKKIAYSSVLVLTFILIYACSKDDEKTDDYVPLDIVAVDDAVNVEQNASVEISILSNDENLPDDGSVEIIPSENATIELVQSSSFKNTSIKYTPNLSFTGQDTFQYKVCDASGEGCATAQVTVTVQYASPVNFDLGNVPYATLSEYNFFEGNIADQKPVFGVVPYEPISSLFTDYALKKRFVWMPNGVKASYNTDQTILDFPVGTILIKSFYYNNVQPGNVTKIIETRLLIKTEAEWIFANYIWNEGQTDALLDVSGDGANVPLEWIQNGETLNTTYRIPSSSECFTCHKSSAVSIPIGPKPQNLNKIYNYDTGDANQLQKLVEYGYLEDNLPENIVTVVDYHDESEPLFDRVRSYIDINCAHCHNDGGHCNYRQLRLSFQDSEDLSKMGLCMPPDTPIPGYDTLIIPGDKENSIFYFRMNTTQEEYRMPLLGRTLIHDEGAGLVGEWIDSLTGSCD